MRNEVDQFVYRGIVVAWSSVRHAWYWTMRDAGRQEAFGAISPEQARRDIDAIIARAEQRTRDRVEATQ